MAITYDWRRGGDLSLSYEVVSGTVTGTETVSSVMKTSAGDSVTPSATFTCTFTEASGTSPDRWIITGSAASSEALVAGTYVADIRVEFDDGTIHQSAPFSIRVLERVTEA